MLVDAHETAPAVAGRLGLGLEPNLRSAVDAFSYGLGDLGRSVVPAPAPAAFGVVPGYPSPIAAAQVTATEVVDVVLALCDHHEIVVVDADDGSSTSRGLISECSAIVGVVAACPVGVVRALGWAADVRATVRSDADPPRGESRSRRALPAGGDPGRDHPNLCAGVDHLGPGRPRGRDRRVGRPPPCARAVPERDGRARGASCSPSCRVDTRRGGRGGGDEPRRLRRDPSRRTRHASSVVGCVRRPTSTTCATR